ncbi:hypothetical protein BT96DRAFT_991883 [Gymnopus androsaceus JB14]|uniref:Uncharacterized protein n=1 Tax=Gymnopus androsaceus JB14 TaxID=1447944 RepID=A0A6A4HV37_9AGAR|nr:hypothetical protein BT96DRAFT_991883 [Gymnopus androsaceus JB14]
MSGAVAGPSKTPIVPRSSKSAAAPSSRSKSSAKLPSALLTRFISLEGDCANSYRFLRVVYLQGLFACALQWSLSNDADISLADWVAFFEMPAPRMVAYKAKYSHYIQPLWAAAFSIAVQGLCRDVFFLSFFLRAGRSGVTMRIGSLRSTC